MEDRCSGCGKCRNYFYKNRIECININEKFSKRLIALITVDSNKIRETLGEKSKEFSSIIYNKDYFCKTCRNKIDPLMPDRIPKNKK
jgi:hypothetical protein